MEQIGGEAVLHYVCEGCGHRHRCRAHPDDSQEALRLLSAPGTDTNRDLLRAIGLPQRVGAFCEAEGLLVGRLGVAVSGGVDSMVLMHCLVEMGHRPLVISMDHGLREESAGELAEVERCARALGWSFRVIARLEDGPTWERARDARYAVIDSLIWTRLQSATIVTIRLRRCWTECFEEARRLGCRACLREEGCCSPPLEESRADISAWKRLKQISFRMTQATERAPVVGYGTSWFLDSQHSSRCAGCDFAYGPSTCNRR